MGTARKRLALLVAAGLLGGLTVLPLQANAAPTTYKVKAFAEFFSRGVPGFSARFLPESITIHKGDTIRFQGFGPTLLPLNQGPTEWREANATFPTDPYFQVKSDPDDGAKAVKFNTAIFGPSRAGCGSRAEPCNFAGKTVLNGGDRRGFSVTFRADAGSVLYAISATQSRMNFRIEVVPQSQAASTQEQLDNRAATLMEQDYETAAALHAKYSDRQTSHINSKGVRVWDAWAGVDGDHVSLLQMYPKRLSIKKGQKVQWHFDLENELHDVIFPFSKAQEILRNSFTPVCDPDGDDGPGPDEPAGPDFPFCDDIRQLEFDLLNKEVYKRGNGVFRGAGDFEGSGVR
ncbi:MAG: hypothetical protein H0U16_07190, partial [Actinobacteria bacterium]|nr:hypothetical protein [Actinomycetota bacterium]